jgi:quinol monooxygenase YgiN
MIMDPILVLISYRAQPGKTEMAAVELSKLIAAVQSEESGCLGITLHQNGDEPARFLLVERWKDRATFEGPHMQTPHLQAFIARAMNFLAGPPEISFWRSM